MVHEASRPPEYARAYPLAGDSAGAISPPLITREERLIAGGNSIACTFGEPGGFFLREDTAHRLTAMAQLHPVMHVLAAVLERNG
jgi:hypothetical protein